MKLLGREVPALALGTLAIFLLSAVPLCAQDTPVGPEGTQVATQATPAAAANTDALRNAAQNPVASLISVPLQENFNFGIGPSDRTQNVLNVQPVIPLSVSQNWNLIVRWISPVIYQPLPVPQPPGTPLQTTGVYGLGDMNPSFFLVPKKSKIIWGIGPTIVLPTATNTTYLGQGKLSMGPSVVALVQPPHWTIGFLANNVWSVAGHANFNTDGTVNKPPVNQFLLQWFVNYNMKKGWYLTTSPIITANWRGTNSNVWTVPFGGGVGRIMKLGFQPVNISASFYGNAVHPPGASPWGLRLQFVLLFPKLTKEEKKMLLEKALKQMDQQPPQKN
ncbi:MAG: hypothetical protein WA639_17675 [Candidatus Acidiferrum sp.]